ncbi:glycosyltransferase family 1 protein [Microbulbifer sp. TRSA001]|uniref:glycosyltransferase family 1 protein n=1 Tax=Microbulbifer sp. TRSA001 TaxID=3243381 RepID=UPI004038FE1C
MALDSIPTESCLVIEEGANPSTDYFIRPYLYEKGINFRCITWSSSPIEQDINGKSLIFVRYIPRSWKSFIDKNRGQFQRIYLFIDDDLFDWYAFSSMPLRYQAKILRLSWSKQRWLKSVGAQLLVSTPYLAEKYQSWSPELLQPAPLNCEQEQPLTVFYHGSASHLEDVQWLRPVIEEVFSRSPILNFEIIGDQRVNRLFRGMPRVQVLHPMKWPTYVSMLRGRGRSIGLAPLLDLPFNRARSHTKFFDITQAGAAGIFAQGDIYGSIVRHGENGLLLPMEPSAWVEGILDLANDHSLRDALSLEARKCL